MHFLSLRDYGKNPSYDSMPTETHSGPKAIKAFSSKEQRLVLKEKAEGMGTKNGEWLPSPTSFTFLEVF